MLWFKNNHIYFVYRPSVWLKVGLSTLSSYTSEVLRNSSNWIHMISKYLQVYSSINGLISLCRGIPRKKNLWFLSGKNYNFLPCPHVFSKMVQIRESFFLKKKVVYFGLVKSFCLHDYLGGGFKDLVCWHGQTWIWFFKCHSQFVVFFSIVTQASATKGAGWAQVLMKNHSQHSQLATFKYNMYTYWDITKMQLFPFKMCDFQWCDVGSSNYITATGNYTYANLLNFTNIGILYPSYHGSCFTLTIDPHENLKGNWRGTSFLP